MQEAGFQQSRLMEEKTRIKISSEMRSINKV